MNHVLTAFILGLAGSFHCVGMCSPLVVAVSGPAFWRKVWYNSGRIGVYMFYGALVAALGNAFQWTEYQNVLTLAVGFVMLVAALTGLTSVRIPVVPGVVERLTGFLKKMFSTLLPHRNGPTLFLLGAVNGMLPCGLTYLALTYCIVLPGAFEGMLFMASFGAGTLAVMLGFTSLITTLVQRFRWNMQRLTTIILLITGFLMIGKAMVNQIPGMPVMSMHKVDAICR